MADTIFIKSLFKISAMIFGENDEIILGNPQSSDLNYYGVCGGQSRTVSLWIKRMEGWNQPNGTLVSWGSNEQDGSAWEIKCVDGILGVYISSDNFDQKIETASEIPSIT